VCYILAGRLHNEARTSSSTSALPDVNKVQEATVEHEPATAVDVSQVGYYLPVSLFSMCGYCMVFCTLKLCRRYGLQFRFHEYSPWLLDW